MMESVLTKYTTPVNQLLSLGKCKVVPPEEWLDYQELGITHQQIPDLIRMATDSDLLSLENYQPEGWAPVHAWRALGQLRTQEAVEPLLMLLDERDIEWANEELPKVFGLIGPQIISKLTDYIADTSKEEFARIYALGGIEEIGKRHPDAREHCIMVIVCQLELYVANPSILNAFLCSSLIHLEYQEALPLMEEAFESGHVDEQTYGDWETFQIEFGLKEPTPEYLEIRRLQDERIAKVSKYFEQQRIQEEAEEIAKRNKIKQAKAKRKMIKATRKRNR